MYFKGKRVAAFIGRHGVRYYSRRLWARCRRGEFEAVLGPYTVQVSVLPRAMVSGALSAGD